MSLENKVAVVTGGTRGIGRAIVLELRRCGACVYFTYRKSVDSAQALEQECGAIALECSQTDDAAIEIAVERILGDQGRIDILVNNAGITSDGFLMTMPFEQWSKVIDTNLNGAFRWCKAVSRSMLSARSGSIVNVASVAGIVGTGGQTNYGASKGGILALTRALAAETASRGVRVNAVVPGFIDTDMTAIMPRQIKRANLDRVALKRFGRPEEVARAVRFLVSDDASYIVGQALVVDGGLTSVVA